MNSGERMKKKLTVRKSSKGFSLVEVLIALAILTVFSLGILEMYKASLSFKTQGVTKLQVNQIRSKLVSCIQNNAAWAQTIAYAGNAVLNCLKNGGASCNSASNGPIQVMDAGSTATGATACLTNSVPGANPAFYDTFNDNHGFTKDGVLCDASVSPDCLFKPKIIWRAIPCAFGICPNPTSAVDISFTFFPGRNDANFAVNLASYSQTIIRGNDFTKNEYILLTEERASGVNAGSCVGTPWRQRMINTKRYDFFGNVTLSGTGVIRFKAGTYSCSMTAPGFRVNRHQARLYDITSGITRVWGSNQYSVTSLAGSMTNSIGKGIFTLTKDSDLAIQHTCPSAFATNNFELGAALSIGGGAPEVYATLECFRRN